METVIYSNGTRLEETKFNDENEFEKLVTKNYKMLFGNKTIYLDVKNKIEAANLGGSVPDGFLFDFRDEETPEFYLVEAELAKHDFYKHIFPQVTRFFAFFKNSESIRNLIEKLFSYIKSNKVQEEFKSFIKGKEIHKALTDIIENSHNILIIIDNDKPEFEDIFATYTEWVKFVKVEVLKQYEYKDSSVLTLAPNFEVITYGEEEPGIERAGTVYDENFHLKDTAAEVKRVYERIKEDMHKADPQIQINPQRYYISLRENRNFAFMKFKKKKLHIVVRLPFNKADELIKSHKVTALSQSVQDFYNGPCFRVTIENEKDIGEITNVLKEAYLQQKA